jgi:hypothetical protein
MLVNLGWHDVIARWEASSNLHAIGCSRANMHFSWQGRATNSSSAWWIAMRTSASLSSSLSNLLALHVCMRRHWVSHVYHCVWSSDRCYPREICSELMKSYLYTIIWRKIFLFLVVGPNGPSTHQYILSSLYKNNMCCIGFHLITNNNVQSLITCTLSSKK